MSHQLSKVKWKIFEADRHNVNHILQYSEEIHTSNYRQIQLTSCYLLYNKAVSQSELEHYRHI